VEPSLVGLSWRRRAGAFLVVSALLSGLLAEVAITASGAAESLPAEDPGRGVVNRGIRDRDPAGPCRRTLAVDVPGAAACTHGPDAAPLGIDVRVPRALETVSREAATQAVPSEPSTAATDAAAVPCYDDGVSGNRVQLIYARAAGVADRFAQVAPSLQLAAAQVDSVFNTSAVETGGTRHVRYVTDSSCKATVAQVALTATGDDNFGNTITELRNLGFSRSDRKYLVWVDANVYCGIGQVYDDDRASAQNYSNGIATVAGEVARVDNGCWALAGQSVEAHELMHTLGGVQTSAPHASPYSHCTDDYDRMCYSDGSGAIVSVVCSAASHDNVFDCNHDDYFSTAPAPLSYLATHWNTANSSFLSAAGTVSASGYNGLGAIGNGTLVDTRAIAPSAVAPAETAVAAGAYHSVALRSDGTVWTWGWNGFGQLGDNTTVSRAIPVQVPGLSGVVAIAAGAYHSVALRSDGTVWTWGWNGLGELGDGSLLDRHAPVQVVGLSGVMKLASGGYHGFGVKSDGSLWAWGWNGVGQLGNGNLVTALTAVQISGIGSVVSVAGGAAHSLAVRSDGSLWAWGWNAVGQLGDNTTTDRYTPTQILGLPAMASVSGGCYHSVALTRTGSVRAWGWNGLGMLGDNTTTGRLAPVTVTGLAGVAQISAGYFHNLAVRADGSAVSWGWNAYGQLGDRTLTDRWIPVAVPGVATAATVSAGGLHSLVA
jgi:alpha-tubulin suppressor-like RCC1 family protein